MYGGADDDVDDGQQDTETKVAEEQRANAGREALEARLVGFAQGRPF
jgi:hypothetical protein